MKVSVSLSLAEAPPNGALSCVVAIDVLRASTSIVTAFRNGCLEVVPVATLDDAWRVAASRPDALLCGERMGKRVDGFDLGNSPLEYSPEVVSGRTLIMSTTNGTVLLRKYDEFERVVGCFANLHSLVQWLLEHYKGCDVHLACAGKLERPGLEDIACAGAIVAMLRRSQESVECDDGALVALSVWEHLDEDPAKAVFSSSHGEYLCSIGYKDDLKYCSVIGEGPVPCIPVGTTAIRGAGGDVN